MKTFRKKLGKAKALMPYNIYYIWSRKTETSLEMDYGEIKAYNRDRVHLL